MVPGDVDQLHFLGTQKVNNNSLNMIYIMDFMARFLVILNSSANFMIFRMVGSTLFRYTLFKKLRLKRFDRRTSIDMLMTRIRSVVYLVGTVGYPEITLVQF